MDKYKILVVDDEVDIREILIFNLQNEGYVVNSAESGEEALEILESEKYDLVILDIMMGGISGLKVADKLKTTINDSTSVIFLTAKITENDMLTGFSLGADDYMTKPFSIKELTARVKAILKRRASKQPLKTSNMEIGGLVIEHEKQRVFVNGEEISLTIKEYEILCLLGVSDERSLSRQEILDKVWRDESYVLDRTVDVHITRIRKKIAAADVTIINRSGYGYALKTVSKQ